MKIENLYISPDHNYFGHHGKPPGDAPVEKVEEVVCDAGRGLRGDRFYDYKPDYKGQITFFRVKSTRTSVRSWMCTTRIPRCFAGMRWCRGSTSTGSLERSSRSRESVFWAVRRRPRVTG